MKEAHKMLQNPWKFNLFMLTKLPLGWIAGLKIEEINEERSVVSVRYGYLTKNPFRSIYFACLTMAGELASGALSIAAVHGSVPAVSMLVINMEASFIKKATGKIRFTCEDGKAIQKAVEESKITGEGRTFVATSTGTDESGEQVAVIKITWSYKVKKK
jgi:hypothetical protein